MTVINWDEPYSQRFGNVGNRRYIQNGRDFDFKGNEVVDKKPVIEEPVEEYIEEEPASIEEQVKELLGKDLTNVQIAKRFGITHQKVTAIARLSK